MTIGQTNIFSMQGAQTNFRNELRLPDKWDPSKCNHMAISGLSSSRILTWFSTKQASKVSINPALQLVGPIWLEEKPFVRGSGKISNNGFDCSGMTLLWIGGKASNLADTESDVRASMIGYIQQHSHNTCIVELLLIKGFSFRIRTEINLGSWSPVWIAVLKTSCFDYLLDKSFLGHVTSTIRKYFYSNSQVAVEVILNIQLKVKGSQLSNKLIYQGSLWSTYSSIICV